MFCHERLTQLRRLHPAIKKKNARLFAIGTGTVEQSMDAVAELKLDFPVFSDPSRDAFRAAELRRNVLATFSPKAFVNAWSTMKNGFRQGKTQGDVLQQGGTLVIHPDGRLLLHFVSKTGGNYAAEETVLSSIKR